MEACIFYLLGKFAKKFQLKRVIIIKDYNEFREVAPEKHLINLSGNISGAIRRGNLIMP